MKGHNRGVVSPPYLRDKIVPIIFPDQQTRLANGSVLGDAEWDCPMCYSSLRHEPANKSAFNNMTKVCSYCHMAEYSLIEQLSFGWKQERSGFTDHSYGIQLYPILGNKITEEQLVALQLPQFHSLAVILAAEPALVRIPRGEQDPSATYREMIARVEWQNDRDFGWLDWCEQVMAWSFMTKIHQWLLDGAKWVRSSIALKNKNAQYGWEKSRYDYDEFYKKGDKNPYGSTSDMRMWKDWKKPGPDDC